MAELRSHLSHSAFEQAFFIRNQVPLIISSEICLSIHTGEKIRESFCLSGSRPPSPIEFGYQEHLKIVTTGQELSGCFII
jgi:hypothetical protein